MKTKMKHLYPLLLLCLTACTDAVPRLHNVFCYNESKGIPTLDPAFARTQAIINPCMQLYCGLLQLDSALHPKPCIAHRYYVTRDGLQYTFNLRKDVFFHDSPAFVDGQGRRVVASDFVYSFYRIKKPATASPGSWTLANMDTAYAINDTTLVLRLRQPSPIFLGILAMPYCFVVPHEAIEFYGADFGKHPVGTGAFYCKAWHEGEKLVLRRNPRYFERDKNGLALPYLEAVNIIFIPDKQSEFLEFVQGNIDCLIGVHPASRDELLLHDGTLNPKYAQGVQMLQGDYLNTEYLGILIDSTEFANAALQNPNVRRAIAYGIDRPKMIQYLRRNLATPARQGFVPKGLPSFANHLQGFDYQPDTALFYLAQAGYPNGNGLPPITLSTTDDYLDICEFLQHELGQLGITIRLNVLSGFGYRQWVAEGKLEFFRASWIADYPDAESYLSLLYSPNRSPNGPNYTHFANAAYDNLYNKAIAEPDEQRRWQHYCALDSMLVEQAVIVPLFYDRAVRFVRRGIAGMRPNPMNMLILKEVQIGKNYQSTKTL
ncbi:peptide ABC transporter substrate-binding protein [Bacteroidia bacterium]|nr:peptide ABC transporter substrate-binding protein [Bacteroidia bacterium]